MKILVLMPLDEKWTYMAAEIYKQMPNEIKEKTLAMPMFMDYLISTKIVGNWVMAAYDAIISAESILDSTDKKEDVIIIGNVNKKYKFDAIFNFQDYELALPYEDKFLEKIREIVKEDENLSSKVNNMYTNDDSMFTLKNSTATADFLTEYIKTDPKLEEIKEKYNNKWKTIDEEDNNGGDA